MRDASGASSSEARYISRTHYNLAASLARSGDDREAEEHFRQALALSPSFQAHLGMAVVLKRRGQNAEAIRHLRDAIRIDPAQSVAHEQLGDIFREQGRFKEAAEQYKEANRIQPNAALRQKLNSTLANGKATATAGPDLRSMKQPGESATHL